MLKIALLNFTALWYSVCGECVRIAIDTNTLSSGQHVFLVLVPFLCFLRSITELPCTLVCRLRDFCIATAPEVICCSHSGSKIFPSLIWHFLHCVYSCSYTLCAAICAADVFNYEHFWLSLWFSVHSTINGRGRRWVQEWYMSRIGVR